MNLARQNTKALNMRSSYSPAAPNAPSAANLTTAVRTESALSGQTLYGDDFSPAEIEKWFEHEREGYFNLYYRDADEQHTESAEYTYSALAQAHGFDWLEERQYAHALGIGSANGAELLPVLERSSRITILEPSEGFVATEIQGKPVDYVKPQACGAMPFANASFDLIICFSVLHHIPNVSTVLREMHRVLKPGGHVLLREPTHSMGDWRSPRSGLTKNERGIPVPLFRNMLSSSGLHVLKETRCNFSLMTRLEPVLGKPVWTIPWVVRLDAWLCRLPLWPRAYHAKTAWQKLRPTGVAYVLEKPLR